ncbi:MAG: hypothetical protein LBE08_09440, partial [Bifidobacteriaceae bacterium]|nr:hypothetical protein [Bifidobacteriaceae bacterium]
MRKTLHAPIPRSCHHSRHRARPAPAVALALALALTGTMAGCGTTPQAEPSSEPVGTASDNGEDHATESDAAEVATLTPRIAYTYDGGIQVRDATTLELVVDLPLTGFNRLNTAGNGRDLMVSTAGGFRVLDLGVWQVAHGDHAHYYAATPVLTDQLFAAETPGHAVAHDGTTALFDDATGNVTVF